MGRSSTQETDSDLLLQAQLLLHVSRTFALTIPQLPGELRTAVANGYLLCRIADTIEDDPGIDYGEKRHFYKEFLDVLNSRADPETFAQRLSASLSDSMPPGEHELIHSTPAVIRLTHSLPESQQEALIRCSRVMCQGMYEFQSRKSLDGLESVGDMYRYCYVVAGVVGEMLTELFCDHTDELLEHKQTMLDLGVCFGLGLQMTNILKDIWEDSESGSCWLPRSIFDDSGNELRKIMRTRQADRLTGGIVELVAIAHTNLHAALRYSCLIPKSQGGIRRFCLWAIGMALLTLQNIYRNPGYTSGQQVKISRRNVKAVVLTCNSVIYSNRLLRAWFDLASIGLPSAEPSEAGDPQQLRSLLVSEFAQAPPPLRASLR
jgi:farnesyl-diphosphate farnesyltransferase